MSLALDISQSHTTPSYAAVRALDMRTVARAPNAAMPDDSLAALQAIGMQARFARNETIFSDGDEAAYAYKVVSGTVRLCKLMSDGRRQIAEFVLPGDFFGFDWLGTYSLTAEALSEVTVIRYARTRLDRLRDEQRDVQRRLMTFLSRDLWAAQNHLVMLGRQNAKERVASFLLALAERKGARDGDTLDIPMGRQDIADYLGLTIETVCRAIGELKRARIVAVSNRAQVKIRSLESLRDIATGDA
ncbi:MAG: helix-turn-helix domain-containing protein [Rhizomicrobium sp.]